MANGFHQRRNDLLQHILVSKALTDSQKCVGLMVLIGYMNHDSEHAWMSAKTLATDLGLSTETVRRALKAITGLALLCANRRTGRTTVYEMGPAYRFRSNSQPARREPRSPARGHPRPQRHPNLKTEPEYEPFSEPRRKRAQGGLRKLTAIKSLEQLCKEAGLEGSEDDDDEAGE